MEAFDLWLHDPATWIAATPLSHFLQDQHAYAFATLETLHLIGMTLVLGAIGAFDLRRPGSGERNPAGGIAPADPLGRRRFPA
jgi:hypothetical protein